MKCRDWEREAGAQAASIAGGKLRKLVLELGGLNPFVVLGDADVKAATVVTAEARIVNSG